VKLPQPKPWMLDWGLALPLWLLSTIEIAVDSQREGPLLLNLLVATGYSLPLAFRRRAPLLVAVTMFGSVAIGTLFLTNAADLNVPLLDVVALGYAVGAHTRGRKAWLGPCVLLAGMITVVSLFGDQGSGDYAFPTAFVLIAWGAARALRSRSELTERLHEAAARAEEAHQEELRAAAAEERRRIAREMHDVIAHSMSVMVVQAGGARRILDRDPARAAAAAAQIERTGREAMAEMRHLLGLLHPDEQPAERAPQPSLGQLDALVARAREAGLPATLYVEGRKRPLPAGLDLAAYRIAQEALTNAIKHANAAPTAVTLRWYDDELELEVRDAGPGGRAAAIEQDGGHGLVGMRERVRLYGGELETEQPPHGGWIVRARLPLSGSREAVPA
jgi:signal transduction histidine kinase